jgi:hypothetical protein
MDSQMFPRRRLQAGTRSTAHAVRQDDWKERNDSPQIKGFRVWGLDDWKERNDSPQIKGFCARRQGHDEDGSSKEPKP